MTHEWSVTINFCTLCCAPLILCWAIKIEKTGLPFPEKLQTINKEMWAFLAQNGNLVDLEVPCGWYEIIKYFCSFNFFSPQAKKKKKATTKNQSNNEKNNNKTTKTTQHFCFWLLIFFPWITISMHYGLHEAWEFENLCLWEIIQKIDLVQRFFGLFLFA